MTVEAVRIKSRYFGLRREREVRILEYRSTIRTVGNGHKSTPGEILESPIHDKNAKERARYVFLHARSEDTVDVVTKTSMFEEGTTEAYTAKEITDAHFVNGFGETIVWRKTQEGDYPPLK